MKYIISMLLVAIFSCAVTAQTPRLKADRVGQVFSPETRGDKEWSKLGNVSKTICLWQEKKSPVSHDVPIVCGDGDGKWGVKDCKCSCHKKDAQKHGHKKATSEGHRSKGRGSHSRSGYKGRSSRSGSKRGTSRRSHARKGPPTKKGKGATEVNDGKRNGPPTKKQWLDINSDDRKKWGDILRRRLQGTNGESRRIDWRKFAQMRK